MNEIAVKQYQAKAKQILARRNGDNSLNVEDPTRKSRAAQMKELAAKILKKREQPVEIKEPEVIEPDPYEQMDKKDLRLLLDERGIEWFQSWGKKKLIEALKESEL